MSQEEAERQRGDLMRSVFERLQAWQKDQHSMTFRLDIEEACEVLDPLLRAALRLREEQEVATQ